MSAGFEVSATVGRTKELNESFLEEPHTDLSHPGFNTIRTAERYGKYWLSFHNEDCKVPIKKIP